MHAIWRGFLNFGLVSIPINLYSAVKSRELEFHLFHKNDKGKIKYARICEKDDKKVSWDEVIKGYEYSKGKYVYLETEDFEKANIHKASSIDIQEFVNEDEIDPIFYEKPYFLAPDKKAQKPYFLLLQALEETKKIAVATFVIHGHEHIATIKPYSNLLILNQLRYLDEIKSTKSFQTSRPKKTLKELNIAIKFIEELKGSFNPKEYKDTYSQDLKKLINQKAKGKKIFPKGQKPTSTKEKDFTSLLEKSMAIKTGRKRKKIA